jgi:hypothetical protein
MGTGEKDMTTKFYFLLAGVFFLMTIGCTQHKVEVAPVEVKPIHITIDVNVKVDRALDDFFSDVDDAEEDIGSEESATD